MTGPSGIVTLVTDFGRADEYVAAMKGVALQVFRRATLIDVSHDVAPQDVIGGAFVLAAAVPWFPAGTVHVAVVDPGVGSARRGVAVETPRGWLVGPDNGILALASRGEVLDAVEIVDLPGWRAPRSATFHGRDVFAPAAALLARGVALRSLGPHAADLVDLALPRVVETRGGARGVVVHVDHFGNAITNLRLEHVGDGRSVIEVGSARIPGLVSSNGWVEIAVTGGSAAQQLQIGRGAAVRIVPVGE
jgi:hypothetical protein